MPDSHTPMDCSRPGYSVLDCLPRVCLNSCPSSEWVGDGIWPSHPATRFFLFLQSFPASRSFQWVGSSRQMAKVLELLTPLPSSPTALGLQKPYTIWSLLPPNPAWVFPSPLDSQYHSHHAGLSLHPTHSACSLLRVLHCFFRQEDSVPIAHSHSGLNSKHALRRGLSWPPDLKGLLSTPPIAQSYASLHSTSLFMFTACSVRLCPSHSPIWRGPCHIVGTW